MRATEFLIEQRGKKIKVPRVGDTTPHDYNPGWEDLNWLKEVAERQGNQLSQNRYQLFVPRPNPAAYSARDRRLRNLATPWAWDDKDPTQLKPDYERWENTPRKELTGLEPQVDEEAPVLHTGKAISPPGRNKPQAYLWTSSAYKTSQGWNSDWADYIRNNHPVWLAPRGYLYKVKPGALILKLDDDYDAERIYRAFFDLNRAGGGDTGARYSNLSSYFPWDQIYKHFDGVSHSYSGRQNQDFLQGWDCESTAWFNTSFLTLVGEVSIKQTDEELDL